MRETTMGTLPRKQQTRCGNTPSKYEALALIGTTSTLEKNG